MAYPKLTDRSGAIETAAAVRRGERTPIETVEHAIARADMGLYKGKDLGRNCVVLIEPQ